MQRIHRSRILAALVLLAASVLTAQQPYPSAVDFTVTMPEPASHIFHVTCRLDLPEAELLDLKMPAWMPGF